MTFKQHAREIYAEVLAFQNNPAVIDMIATRLERIHNDGIGVGIQVSVNRIMAANEPMQAAE